MLHFRYMIIKLLLKNCYNYNISWKNAVQIWQKSCQNFDIELGIFQLFCFQNTIAFLSLRFGCIKYEFIFTLSLNLSLLISIIFFLSNKLPKLLQHIGHIVSSWWTAIRNLWRRRRSPTTWTGRCWRTGSHFLRYAFSILAFLFAVGNLRWDTTLKTNQLRKMNVWCSPNQKLFITSTSLTTSM